MNGVQLDKKGDIFLLKKGKGAVKRSQIRRFARLGGGKIKNACTISLASRKKNEFVWRLRSAGEEL